MGDDRKSKKPHRWTGELKKPIRPKVIRPRGLAVAAETAQAANKVMEDLYRQAIENEYLVKLDLLMDDYGITDKTNFFHLALALAHEHVPGFKLDPTPLRLDGDGEGPRLVVQDNYRGRPPKWPEKRLELLSAVEQAKKKNNLSTDHDALSLLARHGEWSRPAGQRSEQWLKTLKNRLAEARGLLGVARSRSAPS
jgi:hypothetical protein